MLHDLCAFDPLLAKALERRGFSELTPVQRAVASHSSPDADFRISSQTGSGKTIAFALLLARSWPKASEFARPEFAGSLPRAAIMVPTRELASQVQAELNWVLAHLNAGVISVTGGTSVTQERRMLHRHRGVLVGTPGRVCDHLRSGALDLAAVETLVLDEADQMLDLGFREELDAIVSSCPVQRRTHFVSATFKPAIDRLARRYQRDAVHVQGTPLGAANVDIQHVAHLVHSGEQYAAILNVLLSCWGQRSLLFARTRADVADITQFLVEHGFPAAAISGELEQRQRERALLAFRQGHTPILVATDVAARGLHVDDVDLVLHCEPPMNPELYVHRSGRTGRAGKKGRSVMLVPASGRARAERLLQAAGVQPRWQPPPNPRAIAKLQQARLKARLFGEATAGRHADFRALAEQLVGLHDPVTLVCELLALMDSDLPAAARELTQVPISPAPPPRPAGRMPPRPPAHLKQAARRPHKGRAKPARSPQGPHPR